VQKVVGPSELIDARSPGITETLRVTELEQLADERTSSVRVTLPVAAGWNVTVRAVALVRRLPFVIVQLYEAPAPASLAEADAVPVEQTLSGAVMTAGGTEFTVTTLASLSMV
jgi:hypothetical protein